MAVIARCPHCDTSFRVTPKQMKAKSGKVRCGSCKAVFNVLEHLIEDSPDSIAPKLDLQWPEKINRALTNVAAEREAEAAVPPAAEVIGDNQDAGVAVPAVPAAEAPADPEPATPPIASEAAPEAGAEAAESREDLAQTVREIRTAPGYNRWAESPLSSGSISIAAPAGEMSPVARTLWPVVSLVALVALLLQGAYHWRTDLAAHLPAARPFLEALCLQFHCTIDLPRETTFVAIESSTLQTDPARPGLVLLDATLRNSASYAQAYPNLELTLTDSADRPLVRRVLFPGDYLADSGDAGRARIARGFPPLGESNLRLWIDVSEIGAVGYRLYLFYP
ncbi:MAG TPA: DUF3426 domain-containing protein [Rhodocyclaceae bacterium]